MQVQPLSSIAAKVGATPAAGALAAVRSEAGVVAGLADTGSQPAATEATDAGVPRLPAAPRRGLRAWNPQLQRRVSDAQQAQNFLDQTASQLQSLKAELSTRLAGLDQQSGQLEAKLDQVANSWRSRAAASAGSLDAQLAFGSASPSQQRFSVRGLDMRSLQSGAKETLVFSVAGSGTGVIAVGLEPGLSEQALVQRFDQALAPAGLRVSTDDSGALIFSVAESAWPTVRDSLAIKGGGIRFPTGQMHMARTDAEPAAVQPETWKIDSAAALRQTLQQVSQAIERVRQARAVVSQALAKATQQVEQARANDDAASASLLAQDFETTGNQPGYQAFSSVAAALLGVNRSRVLSLLALPGTP